MVFEYKVKFGGKYYEAGEDVPTEKPKGTPKPSPIEEAIERAEKQFEEKVAEIPEKRKGRRTKA